MVYRIRQFIWAVSCNFKEVNYEYISKFLDNEEITLFNKLKHSDKHHCIRVCNDCLKIKNDRKLDIDEKVLGKIALLHDIGKSEYKLNLIQKSLLVIMHKITKGKLKRFSSIKAINIYYNHGIKGQEILSSNKDKYNKEILDAIQNHHNYYIGENIKGTNNIFLEILIEADNSN